MPRFDSIFWCNYLVATVTEGAIDFVTYPFDLLKTRLQLQGEIVQCLSRKHAKFMIPYHGTFLTTIDIIRDEGILHLWKGFPAALLRHGIYSGTKLIAINQFSENIFKLEPGETFSTKQSAISGFCAGAIGQFLASPADLVKVRVQMEGKRKLMGKPPRVTGIIDALVKEVKADGLIGLWQGATPNALRSGFISLGNIGSFNAIRNYLVLNTKIKDENQIRIISSFIGSFIAALVAVPADVLKSRVMNMSCDEQGRPLYKNTWDCLIKLLRNEGLLALFKGLFPFWIRIAPWTILLCAEY